MLSSRSVDLLRSFLVVSIYFYIKVTVPCYMYFVDFEAVNLRMPRKAYKIDQKIQEAFHCRASDAISMAHHHLLVGILAITHMALMGDGKAILDGVIETVIHNLTRIQVHNKISLNTYLYYHC